MPDAPQSRWIKAWSAWLLLAMLALLGLVSGVTAVVAPNVGTPWAGG